MRHPMTALFAFLLSVGSAAAQSSSADSYSRYELLAPETASFRIVYDVAAATAGARFYFNPIREGSEASDESVIDRMTGEPLKFEVVTGEQARADGQRGASAGGHYIKIHLARPVPEGGEARLRIIKTYKDPKSYYTEGDLIVFDRSLGIKRNAVVLPPGYELVSCNFPSQVIEEADGRLAISHWNNTPSAAPLVIKARRLPPAAAARPAPAAGGAGPRSAASAAPAPARPCRSRSPGAVPPSSGRPEGVHAGDTPPGFVGAAPSPRSISAAGPCVARNVTSCCDKCSEKPPPLDGAQIQAPGAGSSCASRFQAATPKRCTRPSGCATHAQSARPGLAGAQAST